MSDAAFDYDSIPILDRIRTRAKTQLLGRRELRATNFDAPVTDGYEQLRAAGDTLRGAVRVF